MKNIPRQDGPLAESIPKAIAPQGPLPIGNPEACLRFRFANFDPRGPGKLLDLKTSKNKSRNLLSNLLERLAGLETMTAAEVFGPGEKIGIVYKVEQLTTPESHRRLEELQLDDFTEIARIAVGNLARLYGILSDDQTEFFVLWWDHSHKIFPGKKWE